MPENDPRFLELTGCFNCKHKSLPFVQEPCYGCRQGWDGNMEDRWESIASEDNHENDIARFIASASISSNPLQQVINLRADAGWTYDALMDNDRDELIEAIGAAYLHLRTLAGLQCISMHEIDASAGDRARRLSWSGTHTEVVV